MTLIDRLQRTGIRRLGTPKRGFRYRTPDGREPSRADSERIEALKIPPAWKKVFVHPSPRGAVQAIGQDAAGRWQYLYHPAHAARRERAKFARLIQFAEALPRMRRAIARDIDLPGMSRERVLACVLRILSTCFLRPGSQVYAQENGSYGLMTLKRRHVTIAGDLVEFDFRGK
jgi:DNA topoisomerase-1